MSPEQHDIGRFTSTPQGVDMADGGSPHGGATRKPPQPMAPDTAEMGDSCHPHSRCRLEAGSASDGWKPPRLGVGGGVSDMGQLAFPFVLKPSK
jgi:hypothetical protein